VNELVWYLTLCGLTAFVTFVCLRIWDFFVVKGAKARAREIISRAEQEAENRRRETEVELKELALRYKEEAEQEFRKIREELHHRQRSRGLGDVYKRQTKGRPSKNFGKFERNFTTGNASSTSGRTH